MKLSDALKNIFININNLFEELGHKSMNFDTSRISSGMNFYRMQADNYVETKELVVIR